MGEPTEIPLGLTMTGMRNDPTTSRVVDHVFDIVAPGPGYVSVCGVDLVNVQIDPTETLDTVGCRRCWDRLRWDETGRLRAIIDRFAEATS